MEDDFEDNRGHLLFLLLLFSIFFTLALLPATYVLYRSWSAVYCTCGISYFCSSYYSPLAMPPFETCPGLSGQRSAATPNFGII